MAENFHLAERYAVDSGLTRNAWRCLYDNKQLRGVRQAVVWLVGFWHVMPQGMDLKKRCEEQGFLVLSKKPLGKKKKRRARRVRDPITGELKDRME